MRLLKLLYLNSVFYTCFILLSIVGIPVLTLFVAIQAPFQSHRRTMKRFHQAVAWYGRSVLAFMYPLVKIECQSSSPSAGPGPCLIICNHRSSSDPFLMAMLPSLDISYDVIQLVNTWPFRIPVIGWFARFAGYISINQIDIDDFYARAEQLLSDGVSIISFPEGTRSGSTAMGPFHSSIFRLALTSKKPIVPICISGNEKIPPRGSYILNPGNIKIRRLPTLESADYEGLSAFQLKKKVWDLMDEELVHMDEELLTSQSVKEESTFSSEPGNSDA